MTSPCKRPPRLHCPSSSWKGNGSRCFTARTSMWQVCSQSLTTVQLMGLCWQDVHRSTDMSQAMALVHLNPLVKKAIVLVTGVIIRITDADIELAVTCRLPWFKVGPLQLMLMDMLLGLSKAC